MDTDTLLEVIEYPLKKLSQLLFSLTIGNTNIGSLAVVGCVLIVIIGVIMHIRRHGSIGRMRKDD